MATAVVPLMVLCTILALNYVSTLPVDFLLQKHLKNQVKPSQPIFYPPSTNYDHLDTPEDKPKNCFHFFVSRNMSSLLADATKMLRTIRNQREREWLLTFIYRIKSLAEHLRAHPESRNYYCLPTDDESKKKTLNNDVTGQQQPELYFVDDVIKRIEGDFQQETKDNQDPSKSSEQNPATGTPLEQGDKEAIQVSPVSQPHNTSSQVSVSATETIPANPTEESVKIDLAKKQDTISPNQEVTQSNNKNVVDVHPLNEDATNAIVLSAVPDCDRATECQTSNIISPEESPENFFSDAGGIDPFYLAEHFNPDDMEHYEQERLKRRIRKALLEELAPEVRKLKTVGGTPEDLMALWNAVNMPADKISEDAESDFDYEESGAAIGDLNLNERALPDRTVAPSLDEVQSTKESQHFTKDVSYEPYDDSDVLVQQLLDARFDDQQSKTTKSLGDQNNNNEYLITSTHTPF